MMNISSDEALKLLHEVTLGLVRETKPEHMPDLTLRQLALMLNVYLDPPPHTVRGLAAKLNVTKPVITRALDALGKYGLVARRRDEKDKRNVIVQRTVKGALYVEKLSDMVVSKAAIITAPVV
jgi:DNA-binding MarR family transcriptional regulator